MSQNTPSNNTFITLKQIIRLAAKPFFFLLFLIMVCSFLAHYLTDSETLEEYARSNPQQAYANSPDTSPSAMTADTDTAANTDTGSHTQDESSAYNIQENTAPAIKDNRSPELEDSAAPAVKDSTPDDNALIDSAASHQEELSMETNSNRTAYQPGFYYEPLSDEIIGRITGISYPETGCTVPYEDLNYVGLLYIDFNGEEQAGELICNKAIAQDMVEIFYELYENQYQIERIRLIDEYDGDDTLSMMDNNTSCFNYRVVDGTTNLSKHALGCAIDINPFYNPYVVFNKDGSGETYISPKGSELYADRSANFPYKIDENDLCYKLFTEHGFTWGGNWNSCKDYQHFQIILK